MVSHIWYVKSTIILGLDPRKSNYTHRYEGFTVTNIIALNDHWVMAFVRDNLFVHYW